MFSCRCSGPQVLFSRLLARLFVTISPYEWRFPCPPWLEALRTSTGQQPTQIATLETLHIAHVLEQLVRGYLCGSNSNRWKDHVFGYDHVCRKNNVITYFHRFKLQQRGTIHIHLLVCLRNLLLLRLDLLQGTIPWAIPEEAFEVVDLQSSNTGYLPVYWHPTSVEQTSSGQILFMKHLPEDAQCNLRAYITSVFHALKCRMDVQVEDGCGMLLRYVSSYVSKCHDVSISETAGSVHLTGFQAASSFLRTIHPLEPEMVFALGDIKVSWSSSRTKRLTLPPPEGLANNADHLKYLARPQCANDLTFVVWQRRYDTAGRRPKEYSSGSILVGISFHSIFNPVYFYEQLLCFWPHRSTADLFHPRLLVLPAPVKYFAQAIDKLPNNWSSDSVVRLHVQAEGQQAHFVDIIVAYVRCLHDILSLWRIRLVNVLADPALLNVDPESYPLSPQQTAILTTFCSQLADRRTHYTRGHDQPRSDATSISSPTACVANSM